MADLVWLSDKNLRDQLEAGDRGQIDEAREAHRRFAALIVDSNLPEFERACLAYMHQAIADGVDARIACAVPHKRGNFSKARRDVDIWHALNDIAHREGIDWHEAVRRLHGNTKTAKRYALHGRLPKSRETLRNIYLRVENARVQANQD